MNLKTDKYGLKPTYYSVSDDNVYMADTIRGVISKMVDNGIDYKPEVDLLALAEYFTFQNTLSGRTLFKDIKIAPPACDLDWDGKQLHITKYWDYKYRPDRTIGIQEYARQLQVVLRDAIGSHTEPIGCYLSGGMDSSSILSLLRRQSTPKHIYTFTCGFDLASVEGMELAFDEREYANYMSNKENTEHYEVVLQAGDMQKILPEMIQCMEDLRLGQSYPNYYVARLASGYVKNIYAGAGGDELFAGYPWRYQHARHLTAYYEYWQRLIKQKEISQFYNSDIYNYVKDYDLFGLFASCNDGYERDQINKCMYYELHTFLRGLLIIEYKIAKKHNLKNILPFLDDKVVDLAMQIPSEYKYNGGDGKRVLRMAMQGIVPDKILNRPKQGFSSPDCSWYKGGSIEYVKQMLINKDARVYDYLNYEYVTKHVTNHIEGRENNRLLIWSLLCFEQWLREFIR